MIGNGALGQGCLGEGAGRPIYQLPALTGSYVLTGIAATLKGALQMAAAKGAYVLTGVAATPQIGRGLLAGAGSYVTTGFTAIVVRHVASLRSLQIRVVDFVLQKRRVNPPTLEE